jgi:hypothetical protein
MIRRLAIVIGHAVRNAEIAHGVKKGALRAELPPGAFSAWPTALAQHALALGNALPDRQGRKRIGVHGAALDGPRERRAPIGGRAAGQGSRWPLFVLDA